ncbi:MAG: hypothetical protein ACRDPO_10450 [Streptosporangiaceae bacterium]
MTDFLAAYVTPAGAGLTGDPDRSWPAGEPARLLLIAVPAGIEAYFAEINAAATDAERDQAGERYGIRVVSG